MSIMWCTSPNFDRRHRWYQTLFQPQDGCRRLESLTGPAKERSAGRATCETQLGGGLATLTRVIMSLSENPFSGRVEFGVQLSGIFSNDFSKPARVMAI